VHYVSSKVYFFPQYVLKTSCEPEGDLRETLEEHAPSYATDKNWVSQFKRGDFSTCDVPRRGRPKTVTNSEIIDKFTN
jgi:hypothetical protein